MSGKIMEREISVAAEASFKDPKEDQDIITARSAVQQRKNSVARRMSAMSTNLTEYLNLDWSTSTGAHGS